MVKRVENPAIAISFKKYQRPKRQEPFLAEMERIVPWKERCALLEPS